MVRHDQSARKKRQLRTKSKTRGNTNQPRLCVYRSNRYVFAQLIDDSLGKTLTSVHSKVVKGTSKIERATLVGKEIAKKAQTLGIATVIFDRAGYRYHGQVKALATGAREGGLKF